MPSGQQMLIDLEAQTKCFVALESTYLRSKSTNLCNKSCLSKAILSTSLTNTGHSGEAQSKILHESSSQEQKNQSSS